MPAEGETLLFSVIDVGLLVACRVKYLRKKLHVSQAGRRRYVRIDLVTKVSENPYGSLWQDFWSSGIRVVEENLMQTALDFSGLAK